MNPLERGAIVCDSHVIKNQTKTSRILSRAGHEKSCLKLGGPPSNPKYYSLTDSAQVPWGKGEKNPGKGSEIEPETICLQSFKAVIVCLIKCSTLWEYGAGSNSITYVNTRFSSAEGSVALACELTDYVLWDIHPWWTAFCIMSLWVVVSGKVKVTRSRSESES